MTRFPKEDAVGRWIDRRPLAFFALLYLIGLIAGRYAPFPALAWGVAALVSLAAAWRWKRKSLAFAIALFIGAATIAAAADAPRAEPRDRAYVTGTVASEPEVRDGSVAFALRGVTANGRAEAGGAQVFLYYGETGPPPLRYGQSISFLGSVWDPSDSSGPGQFDYRGYLLAKGLHFGISANVDTLEIDREPGLSVMGLSISMREGLRAAIRSQYSERLAPAMESLILGDRSGLPGEAAESYRRSGIVHLLSASGIHLFALAFLLERAFRWLRLGARASCLAVVAALIAYGMAAGFPVSAIRATILFAATRYGRAIGRPADKLTGLAAAFMLLAFINPLAVTDAGFALSFSAAAGVCLLAPTLCPIEPRGGWRGLPTRTVRNAAKALAAQLGALPAIAYCFHEIQLYGLIANVLAAPFAMASFAAGLVGAALKAWIPAVGAGFAWIASVSAEALFGIVRAAEALPSASLRLPSFPAWILPIYAACAFLASPYARSGKWAKRSALAALPALCALAVLLAGLARGGGLEILFLDVGQGDAAVVRAQGTVSLIDVGERREAADYLLHTGQRAERVFLSHPHADHAGGMDAILAIQGGGTLYLPYGWDDVDQDEAVAGLAERARERGWRVEPIGRGDAVRLSEDVEVRALHPPPDVESREANPISSVLEVRYGDGSAIFTGDLPASVEGFPIPDCDVLKVAHHGSNDSTGEALLMMASPSVAVISVGRNAYGHPSEGALERLANAGARIYRTDECGTIAVELGRDGGATVRAWRAISEGP